MPAHATPPGILLERRIFSPHSVAACGVYTSRIRLNLHFLVAQVPGTPATALILKVQSEIPAAEPDPQKPNPRPLFRQRRSALPESTASGETVGARAAFYGRHTDFHLQKFPFRQQGCFLLGAEPLLKEAVAAADLLERIFTAGTEVGASPASPNSRETELPASVRVVCTNAPSNPRPHAR